MGMHYPIDACQCKACIDEYKRKHYDREHQMINSEMTLDEAVKKIADMWHDQMLEYYDTTVSKAKQYVESLEALGIIKFKEDSVFDKLQRDPVLHKQREVFRKELADAGLSEHTTYSSPVLTAFDKAHGLR